MNSDERRRWLRCGKKIAHASWVAAEARYQRTMSQPTYNVGRYLAVYKCPFGPR